MVKPAQRAPGPEGCPRVLSAELSTDGTAEVSVELRAQRSPCRRLVGALPTQLPDAPGRAAEEGQGAQAPASQVGPPGWSAQPLTLAWPSPSWRESVGLFPSLSLLLQIDLLFKRQSETGRDSSSVC